MDKQKWMAGDVTVDDLLIKLMEEVGEVAREISDTRHKPKSKRGKVARTKAERKRLLEELQQVRFLTICMIERVEDGG